MSYENNHDTEYGENRHRGHHQDDSQGDRYNRNDDGNVDTGGYGRETTHGHHASHHGEPGGFGNEARHNLGSHGSEERRGEYDNQQGGARSSVGGGETYVGLNRTGDSERRTTDAYGGESNYYSNNQGGYGGMGSHQTSQSGSGGTYVSGSGQWKPGQKMTFVAAEAESEENPFAPVAQQYAGDTQGALKGGVKDLENWVEGKAKEILGSK